MPNIGGPRSISAGVDFLRHHAPGEGAADPGFPVIGSGSALESYISK
jgi:hypothetical protein